jgi:hypothetical protein
VEVRMRRAQPTQAVPQRRAGADPHRISAHNQGPDPSGRPHPAP